MTFKAVDAAFEGFRIIRREPMTVVGWGLASLAFGAVVIGLMFAIGFPGMMQRVDPNDATAFMQVMARAFLFFIGAMVLYAIAYAVGVCAIYRTVLRPGEKGFARLRLGADEWRMLLLAVILGAMFFAGYIVVSIVASIVGGLMAAGSMMGSGNGGGGMATGSIISMMVVIYGAILAYWAAFGTLFSMAGPMTFSERKLHVFSSFRFVQGNFWKLLGCYVLVGVIVLLIYAVLFVIQWGAVMAVGGPNLLGMMANPNAPPRNMAAAFTPAVMGVGVVLSFFYAAIYVIVLAPGAAAYRELAGLKPEARADIFS